MRESLGRRCGVAAVGTALGAQTLIDCARGLGYLHLDGLLRVQRQHTSRGKLSEWLKAAKLLRDDLWGGVGDTLGTLLSLSRASGHPGRPTTRLRLLCSHLSSSDGRSVAATECGEQLAPMFGAVGRTRFVWHFTTT
jgi:hypothetical protein